MRATTFFTLLAAPFLALAQDTNSSSPNPFNIPSSGLSFTAGEATTLRWDPTTSGTVSLILRSGSSNNLNEGTTIASSIDNSGSYTWTPTNAFTRGSDYTIEIVSDSDPSATNYTPYFVLDTDNTVASQTGTVGSVTATPSDLSTAAATGSATSLTGLPTASQGALTTMSGSAASSAASASASGMSTMTSGSSSETTSQAGLQASGTSSAAAEQTGNAGHRQQAALSVVGAIALGALAL